MVGGREGGNDGKRCLDGCVMRDACCWPFILPARAAGRPPVHPSTRPSSRTWPAPFPIYDAASHVTHNSSRGALPKQPIVITRTTQSGGGGGGGNDGGALPTAQFRGYYFCCNRAEIFEKEFYSSA